MYTIIFSSSITPIAFSLGSLDIRWYSLAYIIGSLLGLFYLKFLNSKFFMISKDKEKNFFDDLFFYSLLGILIGGRLGYVLFYGYEYYLHNIIKIFYLWEGGMSYHGGLLGVIFTSYLISKKYKKHLFAITDILALAMPIGLFLGRIANFINAELYGKITNVPWGVVFPNMIEARHPSQLYEAFFEGLVLFLILLILFLKGYYKKVGFISSLAMLCYGSFRFAIEFFRVGEIYFFNIISMGQILCFLMIVLGFIILHWSYKNQSIK